MTSPSNKTQLFSWSLIAAGLWVASPLAAASPPEARATYNLPRQPLGMALRAVGAQSGREIMYSADAVAGRMAEPLIGSFSADEAIGRLLAGSDLLAEYKDGVIYVRGRALPSDVIAERSTDSTDIIVTGSRIRGAPVASSTITLSQRDIKNAGYATVADAMRTIPQNFGGGQNPGIGSSVPIASGVNTGGASTLNLRGLGSGATLTLLNGHRLAYNVTNPAVDISSIPLEAVDRIEIVADGASALYGSDAVAGVANIVLKRDFSGLTTLARVGASTDGGNFQQQYSLVAGTIWSSGGIIAASDFERDTAVRAGQRSYAKGQSPDLTLYPFQKHHSALVSGHQLLASNLDLSIDALYNHRSGHRATPFLTSGSFRESGVYSLYRSTSFAIAPALALNTAGWRIVLSGMIGGDRTHYGLDNYSSGSVFFQTRGCYCNKAQSAELAVDGTVVELPGGPLKVAAGAGYRNNDFHGVRTKGAPQNIHASQDSYYGYGEVSLPLVGSAQAIPFVDRLVLSGAIRYEDYPDVDRVATPKVGLVYAPTGDVEFKGSWGKSFKAPSLWEQYQAQIAYIEPASDFGAVELAPEASVILLEGGNSALKPERATTWSATLAVHPVAVSGLRAELTYFSVRYRDRIADPITFETTALVDDILEDVIMLAPSDAIKAAALSGAATVNNLLDGPYNPNDVVAIIDNRNHNVARQHVTGVDAFVDYAVETAGGGSLHLTANAAYLRSRQQLNAQQPVVALAGAIFNPPHVRARGGLTWSNGSLTLSSFANYTGSVRDVRQTPLIRIGSLTSFDATARYQTSGNEGALGGLDLTLSIQNIFDAKPPVIRSNFAFTEPYDSTNHTPFGRFISFAISKHW